MLRRAHRPPPLIGGYWMEVDRRESCFPTVLVISDDPEMQVLVPLGWAMPGIHCCPRSESSPP
jgi:hypothetical protein